MKEIIESSLKKSTSYTQYRNLVEELLSKGLSTGPNQSEALLNYSMLNDRRMARLDKKIKLSDETIQTLHSLDKRQTWLLITEGWCGDAAQISPVINKMSLENDKIDLKVVLRDENEALMNEFLTNGNMAIPKLVLLNEQHEVISSWGPRPSEATQMVVDYKKENGALDAAFKQDLQMWYNKDKGTNVQKDILSILVA